MAEGLFGVVEAGFHGAEVGFGDGGDFGEGKIFEEVEEENGAVGFGQAVEKGEEFGLAFLTEEEFAGVGEVVGDGFEGVFGRLEELPGARGAAPVLDDALMGDAEEPGAEAVVVAQG